MILGIDTSNYTTSAALLSEEGVLLADCRRILAVKKGERGLRQQEAVWQHVKNLPEILSEAFEHAGDTSLSLVAVSVTPRRQEGSYMPVFEAGRSFAEVLAVSHGVPLQTFSHQEGHLAAALSDLQRPLRFAGTIQGFHLSGGTCELLRCSCGEKGYESEIIGGSRDISFGQVIDRVGVALGLSFPAGAALDRLALSGKSRGVLTKIKVQEGWIHLSGLETQCQRMREEIPAEDLAAELFDKIAEAIRAMAGGRETVLMGGVAESRYLRQKLAGEPFLFPGSEMGRDNSVGIAYLGREALAL